MLHSLLKGLDKALRFPEASAHCDIPCKVYDPAVAQISALTIIRLQDLLKELEDKDQLTLADHAQFGRLIAQKEEHAAKVKDEIRIIWGDYFKAPQFEKIPNAHELTHSIMLQASKCKQNLERANGEKLLELVNEFAEAFWMTKDVATFTATCPYPPQVKVVYPKLDN
ncbi:superoxide dismutase, Ni [Gammaproteobacteria bacterium 45_16_T64]|nr:superoxide dismutase, Ni [Gammaproteobacteria bacterium 45_16_T64]